MHWWSLGHAVCLTCSKCIRDAQLQGNAHLGAVHLQVMLSGRHLRVSFQLGPLSDKQREKLQVHTPALAASARRMLCCLE